MLIRSCVLLEQSSQSQVTVSYTELYMSGVSPPLHVHFFVLKFHNYREYQLGCSIKQLSKVVEYIIGDMHVAKLVPMMVICAP